MDLFILQLAIVFLPGLIWANIDRKFACKTNFSQSLFLLNAFLFGLVTYSMAYVCLSFSGFLPDIETYMTLVNEAPLHLKYAVFFKLFAREFLFSILVSLLLSFLWLYACQYKIFSRLLQTIKATKKYGDEDVWDFTFNSHDAAVEYVHFRDFEKQLVYAGWVSTFSETGKLRELTLSDVIVYSFEGDELYTVPRLYIARKFDDITVEFPYTEE